MAATSSRRRTSSYEDYKTRADELLAHLAGSIKKLGELLTDAKEVLSAVDYERLERHLAGRLRQADIKAAIAVAEGELDERLFFRGASSSKILAMKRATQARLLDPNDLLEIKTKYGDIEHRAWLDMTEEEQDRVISGKGGRILPGHEQRIPGEGATSRVVPQFDRVKYIPDGELLEFQVGKMYGQIEVALLRTLSVNDLTTVIAKLQR